MLSGRWNTSGRRARGVVRLTLLEVLRVRQWAADHPDTPIWELAKVLAPCYHVSTRTIEDVLRRHTWVHVPEEVLTERPR